MPDQNIIHGLLSSTLTLPALAGLGAVSGTFMATMGPKWAPAADPLKVMCLFGMSLVFIVFTSPMLQALSRPLQAAGLEWTRAAANVAGLIAAAYAVRAGGVSWQLMGVALANLLTAALIVAPVYVNILMRTCGMSFRELAGAVAPSVTAAAVTAGSVALFAASGCLANNRPVTLLLAEVMVGGICGTATMLWLDPPLRSPVLATVPRLGGLRSVPAEYL